MLNHTIKIFDHILRGVISDALRTSHSPRFGMLLVLGALFLTGCGPPPSERPREGAQVGPDRRLVLTPEPSTPTPMPSPPEALDASSSPVAIGSPQAPNAALLASPSPSPSPAPAHVIVATDGAGANLRTGPSTSAPVVTTLAEGTLVVVLGDPVSAEGRSWRQIRSGSREGWVVAVVVRPR